MKWESIVEKISPYIVKIETQDGHGTGFLYLYNEDKSWCGIATALHVVDYADEWQLPIRILNNNSSAFLKVNLIRKDRQPNAENPLKFILSGVIVKHLP